MGPALPPASKDLIYEFDFITSRSSGPGGQNVNKVNSKVTLKFDLARSTLLSAEQKELLLRKLAHRLTSQGILLLTSQEHRSQLKNKEAVLWKFDQLIEKAFIQPKTRKKRRPGKAAKAARVKSKRLHAEKKQWRKKPQK
jgi:ribosome-associated protein